MKLMIREFKISTIALLVITFNHGLAFCSANEATSPANSNAQHKVKHKAIPKPFFSYVSSIEKRHGYGSTSKSKLLYAHQQLCKYAKAGDGEALFSLGWMHENGKGNPKNPVEAEQLYRMAATKGFQPAINLLKQFRFNLDLPIQTNKLPECLKPPVKHTALNVTPKSKPSPKIIKMSKSHPEIFQIIKSLTHKISLDPFLVLCFISIESSFNTRAVSSKNAQGLMQLIPETASRFGVANTFSARDNIRGGMRYLEWLLAYYEGNLTLTAAAYNAGEGAVDKYQGVPPYKETKLYVARILKLYNKTTHDYVHDQIKPSPLCNKSC